MIDQRKLITQCAEGLQKAKPGYFLVRIGNGLSGSYMESEGRHFDLVDIQGFFRRVHQIYKLSPQGETMGILAYPHEDGTRHIALVDQKGEYIVSSEESDVEIDLVIRAQSVPQSYAAKLCPFVFWARYALPSTNNPSNSCRTFAVASDPHLMELLCSLAKDRFGPLSESVAEESDPPSSIYRTNSSGAFDRPSAYGGW